jgi:hypothetical protein
MSFLAQVSYTGNGSTTQYSITFPYIDVTHVKAYLNGTLTSAYTISSSTLTFTTAPANGVVIRIERETPNDNRLVDFTDGSVLTEQDLDRSADQNFYIAQEITDDSASKLGLDTDDKYNAQSKVIKNLANPVNDTDAVNKQFISTNLPNINTVAGISGAVSTVAGISSAVTGVNANNADVSTVAGQISPTNNISTLAGINADITAVANNNADVSTVAGQISPTNNISTLAGLDTEITGVYNIRTNVTNVDTNSPNVNLVAGQISPTNNIATLGALGTQLTNLGALGTEITNLNNIRTDITGVNNINSQVQTVAGLNTEITNLDSISADITAVANISGDIQDVQDKIAELQTVANDLNEVTSEIETVAGSINQIDAIGNDLLGANNIGTVATNIADVNSFANTYRIAASAPVTSLDVGDLYFDTTANELKVYKASGWSAAGSTVNGTSARFTYNITGTPSSVSGADANGNTLAYDAGFADVYVNGVRMSSSDITITSGTSVVFATALSDGDVVDVVAYGTFSVAAIDASNITSGTLNSARLPTIPTTKGGTGLTTLGSAGQALKVNSGGTALEFGDVSVSLSYTKGTFTGDNSTTAFTIDSGRAVDDVLVYVNGFLLTPTSDYIISGTTLTFVTAPATSAEIVVRYLPLNNSGVYTNDTATGDNSTTAFTIDSGRTVEDVIVTVNGVTLVPATDYTISGTTLTFTTAPTTSAEISIRYLRLT